MSGILYNCLSIAMTISELSELNTPTNDYNIEYDEWKWYTVHIVSLILR